MDVMQQIHVRKRRKAEIELRSQYPLKDVKLENGKPIKIKQKGRVWKAEAIMEQPGKSALKSCTTMADVRMPTVWYILLSIN